MFDSLLTKYPQANSCPRRSNSLSYLKRVFFAESRHRSRANSSRGQLVSSSYLLLFFLFSRVYAVASFPSTLFIPSTRSDPLLPGGRLLSTVPPFFIISRFPLSVQRFLCAVFMPAFFFQQTFFTRIVLPNKFCCNPLTLLIVRIERPNRAQIIHFHCRNTIRHRLDCISY